MLEVVLEAAIPWNSEGEVVAGELELSEMEQRQLLQLSFLTVEEEV